MCDDSFIQRPSLKLCAFDIEATSLGAGTGELICIGLTNHEFQDESSVVKNHCIIIDADNACEKSSHVNIVCCPDEGTLLNLLQDIL